MSKTKIIKYDYDARTSIKTGIEKLTKAVASTLGPAGKTVIISSGRSIRQTKDGVTVAKSVVLKDPFENVGATVVKEVASKTNDSVGDGTTTATILGNAIYAEGLKAISAGANAKQIKSGIDKTAAMVTDFVKSVSRPVENAEDIEHIATISANGDKEIGQIIASVMDEIGKDGTIKVEDGSGTTMSKKIVKGMQFDRGYVSPYFVTNEALECNMENPLILITDKKLSNIQELLPLLQQVGKTGRGLLIIADEVEGDVLSTLVLNRLRNGMQICAVRAPSFGDNRKDILNDLAILTGGTLISEETGLHLDTADVSHLGSAKKVTVTKDSTTIIEGLGEASNIDARIMLLRANIETAKTDYERSRFKERLAKLAGGVGIIQVGAQTEAELKEKRDRVDDAFNATKAAVDGGIIPGGGVVLLKSADKISSDALVDDELIGFEIVKRALQAPITTLCNNAGFNPSRIIDKVLSSDNISYGCNIANGEFGDLLTAGVVDPANVTINAVKNAASIAGLLLTTEAIIVDDPDEKEAAQMNPPMGMY